MIYSVIISPKITRKWIRKNGKRVMSTSFSQTLCSVLRLQSDVVVQHERIRPNITRYTCKCLLQLVVNVSVHLLVHFLYLGTGETELDFITGFLLHASLRAKQRICDFHSGFHVKTVQFFPAQDSVSVPVHQPEKLYRDKKLNSL